MLIQDLNDIFHDSMVPAAVPWLFRALKRVPHHPKMLAAICLELNFTKLLIP